MKLATLICCLIQASLLIRFAVGAPINFVLVTDSNNEVAKAAVKKAATSVKGAEITVVVVEAAKNWGEKEICTAIFAKTKHPTLLIDATREPDPSVNRVSEEVKKVARNMALPTISLTPTVAPWPGEPLTTEELEILVQVQPPDLTIAQIAKGLHSLKAFNSFLLAYDDTFPLKTNIVELLQPTIKPEEENPKRAFMEIVEDSSLAAVLSKLEKDDYGNLLVFASVDKLNKLVAQINDKNMFKRQYSYAFFTKDDKDLSTCATCVNSTLLFSKPVQVNDIKEFFSSGLTFDAKVDAAFYYDLLRLVGQILHTRMGSAEGPWPEKLVFPECGAVIEDKADRAEAKLRTYMEFEQEALGMKGVFGNFVIKTVQNGDQKPPSFQMDKMKIDKLFLNDSKIVTTSVGEWESKGPSSPASNFKVTKEILEPLRAAIMLRITTLEEPPFIYKKRLPNGDIIKQPNSDEPEFEGYCIDLIDAIKVQPNLNFEYKIFETKERVFGEMHPQGPGKNISWSGMIGDLVNNSADIALGPLAVMAERETVVDFTVPYYDLVGISILMKKPEVKSSLFKFLTVLETNVWMCILGSYFFTSFMMYLFDRISPYSFHNNREKYKDDEENRDFNIKECLWFCMTSLTPQGGGEAPRNLSGRLVAATWWLFGFIIIASYTANLAAFLTVSRLDSSIESLDDLSKQYKIKYAPVEGSTSQTYFRRMAHIEERFYEIWKNMSLNTELDEVKRSKLAVWDYPVSDKYTKIWLGMMDTGFPTLLEEGINQTLASEGPSEGFALIADSTQVKYAVMIHCELTQVGSEFSRKPLALAVQQGSDLKDKLSSAILKLLNERKLESLKEAWWTRNPYRSKCDTKDKQSDGISIANIGGVFIVIFIGVILACITLAIEYFYYKGKRVDADGNVISVKDYGGKEGMKR